MALCFVLYFCFVLYTIGWTGFTPGNLRMGGADFELALRRARSAIESPHGATAIFFLLIVVAGVLVGQMGDLDIAVGPLRTNIVGPRSAWVIPLSIAAMTAAFAACQVALTAAGAARRQPAHALLWRMNALAVFLVAIMIAVVWGEQFHPSDYPVAVIRMKDNKTLCGQLVLTSDKWVVLWRAANGKGVQVHLRADDISEIDTGESRNLRQQIAAAALNPSKSMPDCSEQLHDSSTNK